jgi:beta-galactosidase
LATWPKASAIGPLLDSVIKSVGIQPGPKTPEGVYARAVDGRILYVNTTQEEQRIPITGTKQGILSHRVYKGEVSLGPWQSDLVH